MPADDYAVDGIRQTMEARSAQWIDWARQGMRANWPVRARQANARNADKLGSGRVPWRMSR